MRFPESLCVFCGSRTGLDPEFSVAASQLGQSLAERNCRLVFGGGHVGLMGVIADAVLAAGGEVTGVIPESLQQRELAHAGVTDMRIVESMHARKALMAQLSAGFVALPGGIGTLEELCEIITWAQLGFHDKPIALLNLNGYFDAFVQLIENGITQGLMSEAHRELFFVAQSLDQLIAFFAEATQGTSCGRATPGGSRDTAIWEQT